MWKGRVSAVAIGVVLTAMVHFIPAIFLSGTEFSVWGYIALLLSLSLAHMGILTRQIFLRSASVLLAIQCAYCLYEGVGTGPVLIACLLLCAVAAVLGVKDGFEHDDCDMHVFIQSLFILLITSSILAASVIEFPEPDVILLFQNYMYGIIVLLLLEAVFGFPAFIRVSYLAMSSAYYVYLYVRLAPFSYPFWLTSFVVNAAFLIYALYYFFTQFSLQNDDAEIIG